jgi:hypothetical protein
VVIDEDASVGYVKYAFTEAEVRAAQERLAR